jgi:hypothetical protein
MILASCLACLKLNHPVQYQVSHESSNQAHHVFSISISVSFFLISLEILFFQTSAQLRSTHLFVLSLYNTRYPHSLQRMGSPRFSVTLLSQSPHK